jgi:hypothetical protein
LDLNLDLNLKNQIEYLRRRLNGMSREDREEILLLSQHLDRLIVQYQRLVFSLKKGNKYSEY